MSEIKREFNFGLENNNILKLRIINGDITKMSTDVIVNAANGRLMHGGGVALAISKAGGSIIEEQSRGYYNRYGEIPVSQVAVTGAGNLNAKYIIHAVGPHVSNPNHAELLKHTYLNIFKKAIELKINRVALPAISTKIFGVDPEISAKAFFDAFMHKSNLLELTKSNITNIDLVDIDNQVLIKFVKQYDKTYDNLLNNMIIC